MTPRTWWDRFGSLWQESGTDNLLLIWDDGMPGADAGWVPDTRPVPREFVERVGCGPLISTA